MLVTSAQFPWLTFSQKNVIIWLLLLSGYEVSSQKFHAVKAWFTPGDTILGGSRIFKSRELAGGRKGLEACPWGYILSLFVSLFLSPPPPFLATMI
jgi:hypothetical protein